MNHPPRQFKLAAILSGHEALLWDPEAKVAAPDDSQGPTAELGKVARASMFGVINGNYCERLRSWLLHVAANDRFSSVLILINSPGGNADGLIETSEIMRRVRKSKPITVVATGLCCSAAFWLAAQSTTFIACPSALLGSVGVRSTLVDSSKFYESLGLKVIPLGTSTKKIVNTEGVPVSDDAIDYYQQLVDGCMRDFQLDLLKSGRFNDKQVAELSDASVFDAAEAKRRGVVDRVALLEDVFGELDHGTAISNVSTDPYGDLYGEKAYSKFMELAQSEWPDGELQYASDLRSSQVARMRRKYPKLTAAMEPMTSFDE
ncbi:S49 family peptidase [Aeoliella sp.]|uniref:S49 family peptidase n=1 Tax=Aeoliella sp. TaxID=2795800 RepID=UPI003CCC453F